MHWWQLAMGRSTFGVALKVFTITYVALGTPGQVPEQLITKFKASAVGWACKSSKKKD